MSCDPKPSDPKPSDPKPSDPESSGSIEQLAAQLAETVEREPFSGVIVVNHRDRPLLNLAAGLADRAQSRPMGVETRLATASVTKGFTALAVVSLIEEGLLGFDTPLSVVVGGDLPHVDPAVTIEQLLGHTSGVGDYLDEDELDDIDDYVLDVPVHRLLGPEDYVPILNRHRQTSRPGTRFVYNNSGYMMLALAIERIAGRSYHDEVRRRVLRPAAMTSTDFLRSDRLPAETALGYLADGRTNVFHLPVIGTGDGGAYTTGADMMRFWDALLAGRIVQRSLVERMTTVANGVDPEYYGLGFWIGPDRKTVQLEGMDAGVSMRTGANPVTGLRYCLMANNSSDVWPLAAIVDQHLQKQR